MVDVRIYFNFVDKDYFCGLCGGFECLNCRGNIVCGYNIGFVFYSGFDNC